MSAAFICKKDIVNISPWFIEDRLTYGLFEKKDFNLNQSKNLLKLIKNLILSIKIKKILKYFTIKQTKYFRKNSLGHKKKFGQNIFGN